MMTSISGERGVGKTLHLADRVSRRRDQGYFTVTNFSHAKSNLDCSGLSPEEFLDVILNIIDFKDNGYEMFNLHPSFRHTGVYIAMDEATIYFSPEMQSKLSKSKPEKYERLLNLLAQARKYDVEIDYVVQDPAKVGKDFRRYTEYYKRFRWFFKIKRMAFIPHPRLPIYRREHRHLIDVVWEEIHELDTENPVFNYRTVRDEHGVAQWAENTTLKERHLRLTGRFKKHVLRMYNSYQPVAVKQQEYRKEFSPLKNFKIIPGDFQRDYLPTFKNLLRKLHIPVRIKDEFLPPKVGYSDLVLPVKDERNKIISEVQSQKIITLDVKELQQAIARAYARPLKKHRKLPIPEYLDPFPLQEFLTDEKIEKMNKASRRGDPIKKVEALNRDKHKRLIAKNPKLFQRLFPTFYGTIAPNRKMAQPDKKDLREKSKKKLPKLRRKRTKTIPRNVDKLPVSIPPIL